MRRKQVQDLGGRLRQKRLQRNDSQADFATRLGMGVGTLQRMESGDSGIAIGKWLKALEFFHREDDLDQLLALNLGRLEQAISKKQPLRKRASRKAT